MPDLTFTIQNASVVEHAAVPMLAFQLSLLESESSDSIQNVLLQVQIQIEATRRRYSDKERLQLSDLFGTPDRWGETLHSLHWCRVNTLIPPFTGETTTDLQVPCSSDFNLPACKYFYGLEEGDLPLLFLFSGTVFYRDESGQLQIAPISWSNEARFRLPVQVWQEMMQTYSLNAAWLSLRKDLFDQLCQFRAQNSLCTWDQTIELLLAQSEMKTKVAQ